MPAAREDLEAARRSALEMKSEDFEDELSAWPPGETSFCEETGWVKLVTALESSDVQPRQLSVEVDPVGYQRFEPGTIALLQFYLASLGITLTVEEGDELEPVDVMEYGASSAMLKDYYVNHFGHRGQACWHDMLMADTLENGNRGWGMMGETSSWCQRRCWTRIRRSGRARRLTSSCTSSGTISG